MGSFKKSWACFNFTTFRLHRGCLPRFCLQLPRKNGNLTFYSYMYSFNEKAGIPPWKTQVQKESRWIAALPGILAGSQVCTSSPGQFQEISRGETCISTWENNTKQTMSRNVPQPRTNGGRGNRNFIKVFLTVVIQWRPSPSLPFSLQKWIFPFSMDFSFQGLLENANPMSFRLLEQNKDHLHQTVQIKGPSPAGLWSREHWALSQGVLQTGQAQPGKGDGPWNPPGGELDARMCVSL